MMFCYKKIQVLFFIAIFDMTFPAEGHKILNLVLAFTATHTTGNYVMYVNSLPSTHFARYIVICSVTEIIKVDFCMLLHLYCIYINCF